jgi:Fe-S-cluster-containing hydrogenase component 2
MAYTIDIDHEKCTGCQSCTISCALKRERIANPLLGRIQVARRPQQGIHIPVVCNQCLEAPCMNVCPVNALSRDPKTQVVSLDYDVCIGCRYCALACPFGAMLVNVDTGKVMKCDLCQDVEGGPICYKVCHNEAIRYVPLTQALYHRRQIGADRMLNVAASTPLTLE